MRQCLRCKSVKYWFQFYAIDYGDWTCRPDVCKRCARSLSDEAVEQYSRNAIAQGIPQHPTTYREKTATQ